MTATKSHHITYRTGIHALATGQMFDPAELDALDQAAAALGIDREQQERDMDTIREAELLRAKAASREHLNKDVVRAVNAIDEHDLETRRRRAELVDDKNRLLGEIQVADAAHLKLMQIERDNRRLFDK